MYSLLFNTNIEPTPEHLTDIWNQLSNWFSDGLSPFPWHIIDDAIDPTDLEDNIEWLEDKISELESDIEDLEDKVDRQTDNIDSLNDEIEKLNEKILTLESVTSR